jgi:ubiquinone/menaquinone biosynthesis C-methylase UbiE
MYNEKYFDRYRVENWLQSFGRHFFSAQLIVFRKYLSLFPQNGIIVDIGAGLGGFLQKIENARPDLRTIGIDLLCPSGYLSKGDFIVGNLSSIPLSDGVADGIVCTHVLEHCSAPEFTVALNEIRRVLKPGGIAYIECPSPASCLPVVGNFWDDPTHIRPYSSTGLASAFSVRDFKIVRKGIKRSYKAIFGGLCQMLLGPIMRIPNSSQLFRWHFWGTTSFVVARKTN